MPAKRKRPYEPWELINRSLGELFSELRYVGLGRKGFTLTYYGKLERLKKICIRILNVIEGLEGKFDEKRYFAKDGWPQVPVNVIVDSGGDGDRAADGAGDNGELRGDDSGDGSGI